MKTIPIALAADYAETVTSICTCLKVTRSDGVIVAATTAGETVTVSGVDYLPEGLDASGLESNDSLSVDNMELKFLDFTSFVVRADVLSGKWNNAAFVVFECNQLAPAHGINILKSGTIGEVTLNRGDYVAELRSLKQAMQQTQGAIVTKTCRANFADYPAQFGSSRCGLTAASFTVTGTLTSVTSSQVMTDSARSEADDYYGEGILSITNGPAAGLKQKVKVFASGQFTLYLPLAIAPVVGNAYSVIAGCRKRRDEDCKTKFNNILNFQGEPDLPGQDALSKAPGSAP